MDGIESLGIGGGDDIIRGGEYRYDGGVYDGVLNDCVILRDVIAGDVTRYDNCDMLRDAETKDDFGNDNPRVIELILVSGNVDALITGLLR